MRLKKTDEPLPWTFVVKAEVIFTVQENWKRLQALYAKGKARRGLELKQKTTSSSGTTVYVLKISIKDLSPCVWRTVTVTDTVTLVRA